MATGSLSSAHARSTLAGRFWVQRVSLQLPLGNAGTHAVVFVCSTDAPTALPPSCQRAQELLAQPRFAPQTQFTEHCFAFPLSSFPPSNPHRHALILLSISKLSATRDKQCQRKPNQPALQHLAAAHSSAWHITAPATCTAPAAGWLSPQCQAAAEVKCLLWSEKLLL